MRELMNREIQHPRPLQLLQQQGFTSQQERLEHLAQATLEVHAELLQQGQLEPRQFDELAQRMHVAAPGELPTQKLDQLKKDALMTHVGEPDAIDWAVARRTEYAVAMERALRHESKRDERDPVFLSLKQSKSQHLEQLADTTIAAYRELWAVKPFGGDENVFIEELRALAKPSLAE